MDLDPAGGLLDALPGVVGTPALDEAHPENAEPAEVVHTDAGSCWETCRAKNHRGEDNQDMNAIKVDGTNPNSKSAPSVHANPGIGFIFDP